MWLGHSTEGSVLCGAKRNGDAGYFVMAHAHRIAHRLRAGTVWINCYNIFDAALPLGGYKQSG